MPLNLPERDYGNEPFYKKHMKKEKLSLNGVKSALSRAEMKKIMAGSGGTCAGYEQTCGAPGQPGGNFPPCCPGFTCVGEEPGYPVALCV